MSDIVLCSLKGYEVVQGQLCQSSRAMGEFLLFHSFETCSENSDSAVGICFLQLIEAFKYMAQCKHWNISTKLSAIPPHLRGSDQCQKTLEIKLLVQSKQMSGVHSSLFIYQSHLSVFGELVILSRTTD